MAQAQQTLIGFDANAATGAPAGFLVCDAVLDASVAHLFEFTEHPVEDGSTLTDHLIVKPEQISLTLVATDTPIRSDATGFAKVSQPLTVKSVTYGKQQTQLKVQPRAGLPQLNVASAVNIGLKALSGAVAPNSITGLKVQAASAKTFSISVLAAGAPIDRIHDFYAKLLELATTATRLTLTFKGYSYPDYVFTSITKSDRPGEFGRSTFPVELRRVRTVATKQTTIPAVPKAKGKKDLGAKYKPPYENGTLIGPPPPPVLASELYKDANPSEFAP